VFDKFLDWFFANMSEEQGDTKLYAVVNYDINEVHGFFSTMEGANEWAKVNIPSNHCKAMEFSACMSIAAPSN
jgi:hypothetical protein